jgi:F-type H+-transporting ATPase subunit delta
MGANQVAQRYAKGWLSAAKDKKMLDSVAGDCNALQAMIKNSPDFAAFLASPLISKTDQARTVNALAVAAKLNPLTVSLLSVLAANRRLAMLADVLEAAQAMLDAAAGTASAVVTSAQKLDDKKVADIRNQLVKKLGKDIAIQTKIDPAIIGGLVVQVGSTMIDDSVKTKLDRMARRLLGQAA